MERNLQESQRRAVQYWFEDGLVELFSGILCFVLAIYFIALQILPSSPGSFALLFLFVFIAAFGMRKLMLRFREGSTYPRTGFIEPKKGRQYKWLLGISIGFTVVLLGFMLYTILRGIQTMEWMPAIEGIIFAFIFALAGYRTKLVRCFFLAAFCLVLGLLLALSGLGSLWGAALLAFFTGLILIAFGIVTRITYLHQSTVTAEQVDEG